MLLVLSEANELMTGLDVFKSLVEVNSVAEADVGEEHALELVEEAADDSLG